MTKRNIFYNTLYQFVNLIIPIIIAPYLSRVIGADGIGLSAYGKAMAGYFLLFAVLGLNSYGNRTIALVKTDKKKVSETFWEIYLMQFISAAISLTIYVFFILQSKSVYKEVLIINIIYVASGLFDINWFYYGIGEFKFTSIRNIIVKLMSTGLIFLLVKSKQDIFLYIIIISLSLLVSNVILWMYLKKYIYIIPISLKNSLKHFKPNLFLFIPTIAVSIYKLMDRIMLGKMSNMVQMGYYENAENLIAIPLSLITAMGTVMLSRISELIKKGEYEKVHIYNRDSIQLMLCASLPFAFGLIGTAKIFVPMYFGNDFLGSVIVVKMLAVTCPFVAVANVIKTQCIIPLKMDSIFVKSTILGAISNFCINILLIPKLGAFGAAIGTVVAEVSVALYQYAMVRPQLRGISIIRDNLIVLIACILMELILYIISKLSLNLVVKLIIQVIGGVGIYFLIIFLYFILFKKERGLYWVGMLRR